MKEALDGWQQPADDLVADGFAQHRVGDEKIVAPFHPVIEDLRGFCVDIDQKAGIQGTGSPRTMAGLCMSAMAALSADNRRNDGWLW